MQFGRETNVSGRGWRSTGIVASFALLVLGCVKHEAGNAKKLEEENRTLKAAVQKLEGEKVALETVLGPPPASLDAYFPPKADEPVYLARMMGLAAPMEAVLVDLLEKDFKNVPAHFERFKAEYAEVSKLVPEWEDKFKQGPVDELGVALESGDPAKVMPAFMKLAGVCHDCHADNMVKVQQRYHWKDTDEIKVEDPVTGEELDFRMFMGNLSLSFAGIVVDTEQGQKENAKKQYDAFKARYEVLKTICQECHDAERKYFVGENIDPWIEQLGQALDAPSVSLQAVGGVAQAIGMESCFKCHLVHIPAAYAKLRWKGGQGEHGGDKPGH